MNMEQMQNKLCTLVSALDMIKAEALNHTTTHGEFAGVIVRIVNDTMKVVTK